MQANPNYLTKGNLLPQEEMLEVGRRKKNISIGIPKEILKDENRVALTPLNVELLVNNGHHVVVESNSGKAANFYDNVYSEHGAEIALSRNEVFKCEVILKVAPLSLEEIDMLESNHIVISSLHAAFQTEEYIRKLIQKRVTALAFEYMKDQSGHYPVVRYMSQIAGSSSILIAAEYLNTVHDGKGEMLGGITGITPSEVVIIGAGTAGEFAARTAIGLGAFVKVFDDSVENLRRLQENLGRNVFTSLLQPLVLKNNIKNADVVIGALRSTNMHRRFVVTEEMVRSMKKGSVIVDISIDEGGCVETSRLTSHSNPVFIEHGVVHYCVPNIASRVARTASYALSNIFGPILLKVGEAGDIKQLLKEDAGVRKGVYMYNGILTNPYIGNMFDIPSKDIELLMAAF
ncbi:MAG: alanine dehydrogenase [Bacteroidetes bacterium GWF2_35_48]|nr:MAG: alanine dehydrogenase [Bacteroidetes bacterium GWF2_35_48]OFZ06541.1 MAG: alanine dehydrogenase [Bacteroidetes bacterium RIFOXYC12_FULL_35_7]